MKVYVTIYPVLNKSLTRENWQTRDGTAHSPVPAFGGWPVSAGGVGAHGITEKHYWRIENWYDQPTDDERRALAKVLNVDESALPWPAMEAVS